MSRYIKIVFKKKKSCEGDIAMKQLTLLPCDWTLHYIVDKLH